MPRSWDSRTSTSSHRPSPGAGGVGVFDHRAAELQTAANLNPQSKRLQTLQGLFESTPVQRAEEEEELQMVQRAVEDEELLQGRADGELAAESPGGLPQQLKSGMENMTGVALDDVKVHRNSSKPASVQAHAYAQGTDIHLASGQEKHLPHELGHVVQQKQGRVQPTMTLGNGVPVNDSPALENEATAMGEKALQGKWDRSRK